MLKSKEGISPILATLLLIVIAIAAVIVTYAWVMTFTTATTGKSSVLILENVRYYNDSGTLKVDVTIRNTGTADAKVVEVYQGTSSSNLQTVTSPTYDPTTQMVSVESSLKITFNISWIDGTTYYFKVVTDAGQTLPFSQEA